MKARARGDRCVASQRAGSLAFVLSKKFHMTWFDDEIDGRCASRISLPGCAAPLSSLRFPPMLF